MVYTSGVQPEGRYNSYTPNEKVISYSCKILYTYVLRVMLVGCCPIKINKIGDHGSKRLHTTILYHYTLSTRNSRVIIVRFHKNDTT